LGMGLDQLGLKWWSAGLPNRALRRRHSPRRVGADIPKRFQDC